MEALGHRKPYKTEYLYFKMAEGKCIPELSAGEFENFTKEGLVLIDFYADWCMPCMMMAPILEEVCEELDGKIKFGKVDVSENQELAVKFGVSSIPNMTLLKDGKVIEQFIGSLPKEELEKALKGYL